MKKINLIIVAACLSACQMNQTKMIIEGQAKTVNMREAITVFVNKQPVIYGELHDQLQYEMFWGVYSGQHVSADCELIYKHKYDLQPRHLCRVIMYKEKPLGEIEF